MNIIEILDNFWAALAIFAFIFIAYLIFIIRHSHSERAKKAFESHLKGCGVDAGIWFAIIIGALALGTISLKAQFVFEQIVGTKLLGVPLIAWSMMLVPLAFSIHSAYPRFDYRPVAISALLAVALVFGVIYWINMP